VVPLLRHALRGADLEQTRRLQWCLNRVAASVAQTARPHGAARLLALRGAAAAVGALPAYLPFTADEATPAEGVTPLPGLASRGAALDAARVTALSDGVSRRRAVAVEILAGRGAARAAVRKLLTDADPTVRLRAAVALACAADRDAVPVLIDLAAGLPADE